MDISLLTANSAIYYAIAKLAVKATAGAPRYLPTRLLLLQRDTCCFWVTRPYAAGSANIRWELRSPGG